ncbi:MAG: 3-dehydroquinate synthase [Nibricoccus sp.]
MVESLGVNLGERSYSLHFGRDLNVQVRAAVDALTQAGRKVVVLSDRNVAEKQKAALAAMTGGAPALLFEAGEETKSVREYARALDFLAEQRVDRTSAVLAIGGGVIGDLAGFVAASYLRGIDFIQVPTTLLAMVDSSVGGKTGINLKAGKNLVGAFHQPKAVYIATGLLDTLPPREFAAGMAEVIKYGLLGDYSLFEQLERQPLTVTSSALAAVVRACCAAKARIVEADERELAKEGGRALLNLGHTFGHAIEQVTGYGTYLHGEAVAIGLAAAARLSAKLKFIGGSDVARVDQVVAAHALPVRLRESLPIPALMAAMARDKKVRGGMLRFVVMKKLGEAATQSGVDPSLVETVWRELGAA